MCVCFRCIRLVIIIVVIIMGCAVYSSFLYGRVVAGPFRLARCDAGFIVGALCGWISVGTPPVGICAVSIVGSMLVISVEYA
jgi:hypothetical protein